jgi:hypothetical protein
MACGIVYGERLDRAVAAAVFSRGKERKFSWQALSNKLGK